MVKQQAFRRVLLALSISVLGCRSVAPPRQLSHSAQMPVADKTLVEPCLDSTESVSFSSEPIVHPASNVEAAAVLSLPELEALALTNNPTIRQLAATTQKAAGFRTQVGLYANPTAGYQGMQLADRGTDQHTVFVEQEFVTGDKLQLNRRVLNAAVQAQLHELEAQRQRVLTDVRGKYFEALAVQKRLELIEEFTKVADEGLNLAELRKKAGESAEVDVLQAKVQRSEVQLSKRQAMQIREAVWRELSALTGTPTLTPVTLNGELPQTMAQQDWNSLGLSLVASSPEHSAALSRVNQAKANLDRQQVQAIPNVTTQLAAGVDNGTNSQLVNVQIGAPIPVFNKNQGNITAARAEYCRAVMDAQRIENGIRNRLAIVSKEYETASSAVSMYQGEILPNAAESLRLAELSYKSGEISFVQVLVARRTYFDSNLQLVNAQTQLAQAQARLDGFMLTGALDATIDFSGDDSLRGQTFSQQ